MKKLFLWSAVAALGLMGTGCAKDNVGGGNQTRPEGEKSFARLTVRTSSPSTRAATASGDEATDAESAIDVSLPLKVYIFEQDTDGGAFISPHEVTLTKDAGNDGVDGEGRYTSEAFEVPASGDVQLFVFANDPSATGTSNKIAPPSPGTTATAFKASVTENLFAAAGTLDIAADNKFLMGTLWAGFTTTITGAGTMDTPQEITGITIGRLSSKISLSVENPGNADETNPMWNTTLPGTFQNTAIRLGSLARVMNPVGNVTTLGRTNPYTVGTVVQSAVHTQAPPADAAAYATSGYYVQYYPATFTTYGFNATDGVSTTPLYATENTTMALDIAADNAGDDAGAAQFYGNTTYVQIRTTFVPDEVFAPTDLATPAATDASGDFWTALVNGALVFFNADPTAASVAGIDLASLRAYTGGVMYYKFPVFDPEEDNILTRNRVLRNHSYNFTVNVVRDLGSSTPDVDPIEPITELTAISVTVDVLDWDKVATGGIDL